MLTVTVVRKGVVQTMYCTCTYSWDRLIYYINGEVFCGEVFCVRIVRSVNILHTMILYIRTWAA